jgi:hypothetical protein
MLSIVHISSSSHDTRYSNTLYECIHYTKALSLSALQNTLIVIIFSKSPITAERPSTQEFHLLSIDTTHIVIPNTINSNISNPTASHHPQTTKKKPHPSSPPPPQKQPLLNRRPLHLIPLHLRQKRRVPKIIQLQIQVPARSPFPWRKEHLSPIDTVVAHEAQQEFAAVFEGREGDAGGLDVVEGGGGEDGGADVPTERRRG